MRFSFNTTSFTLFNVYLPYESNDNEDEFIEKLGLLESYIQNVENSTFAIIGDFNSNIKPTNGRVKSKFAKFVFDFCDQNALTLASQNMLPSDSYTYVSERWGTTSWLDLLICSSDFNNSVCNLKIEHELTSSDHIPFSFNIITGTLPAFSVSNEKSNSNKQKKVCWKKLNCSQCETYRTFTELYYDQSDFGNLVPLCSDPNCKNMEHRRSIDKAYNDFINILTRSSDKVYKIKHSKKRKRGPRKPGWSDYVKEKHLASIEFYKLWRDNGKPRQGPYFEHYHRSKLSYKYAVRAIKRKTDTIQADNVANKLNNSNYNVCYPFHFVEHIGDPVHIVTTRNLWYRGTDVNNIANSDNIANNINLQWVLGLS